jgi:hypothetical protein
VISFAIMTPSNTTTNDNSNNNVNNTTNDKNNATIMPTTRTIPPTVGPYRMPLRTAHRAYQRKDDNPHPTSPLAANFPASPVASEEEEEELAEVSIVTRIFASPRCTKEDDELFPTDHSVYHPHVRWTIISEQAGPHRQDGSVLTVRRDLTPRAMKLGMTTQAAFRVRCLNLWLDHDILPEWLDVVANLFPNLQHLTLSEDYFKGEEEIEVSARMRRLYVLYRLPDLRSIDDMRVTRAEKKLARPNSPNGERVPRTEWMGSSESLLDDEDDENQEGPPRISYNESIGNHTATELGNDIAELAEKVAAIHEINIEPMEEDLAGELIVDFSMSSSGSGEQREDSSSSNVTGVGDRDDDALGTDHSKCQQTPRGQHQHHRDAVEVDLSGAVRSIRLKDSKTTPDRSTPSKERPTRQKMKEKIEDSPSRRRLRSHPSLSDTLELVSVASSQHEWTAACGVLAFRSDQACAPRLRLPFCGPNRQKIADEDDWSIRNKAKMALRRNHEKQIAPCPPVQRQSSMKSPKRGSEANADGANSFGKFFPTDQITTAENKSANEKVPPSKSLSSPFPMQFRERTTVLHISTKETDVTEKQEMPSGPRACGSVPMDTITQPITLTRVNSSPKKFDCTKAVVKGDLPPPCPGGTSRRRVAMPTVESPLRSRKARKMMRRKKALQANARSTSVLDMDDEDDEDDEDEDFDEDEIDFVEEGEEDSAEC